MDFATYQNLKKKKKNRTDNHVAARFYNRAVKTGELSEDGLPIFKDVCYCEIRIKDNTTEVFDQPATEEKINRFPLEYARYQLSQKQIAEGTPLEEFAFLTASEIESCKCHGVFTIETLASLDEEKIKNLGLSAEAALAKKFISGNKLIKQGVDIAALEEKYRCKIADLEAEISRLKSKPERRKKK